MEYAPNGCYLMGGDYDYWRTGGYDDDPYDDQPEDEEEEDEEE